MSWWLKVLIIIVVTGICHYWQYRKEIKEMEEYRDWLQEWGNWLKSDERKKKIEEDSLYIYENKRLK